LDDLTKIVTQRAIPGTLIFDLNQGLLFINQEALGLLPEKIRNKPRGQGRGRPDIPPEIYSLCDRIKGVSSPPDGPDAAVRNGIILGNDNGHRFSARAFPIGRGGNGGGGSHIMVLLERVVERRAIPYREVAERYQLSKREIEVVQMICDGSTNREIGDQLYISEHTVKDHIKNIMRKMQVATRNELVAALL
jgi:DNA-binding CsgD family transcriptional regulator